MTILSAAPRVGALARRAKARLRQTIRDRRGVAMIELGLSFPLLLLIGFGAIETSNLVITHTQLSQIALTVADNASRIRSESALALPQVREADINQIFTAANLQGAKLDIENKGLIILSSLEQNSEGGQWLHWQRCYGKKAGESSFGKQGDGSTGTSFPGMGETGAEVVASDNSAVMFVEIHYDYEPLLFGAIIPDRAIKYTGAFTVRDKRDLTQIYNPDPVAPVADCSDFTLDEAVQEPPVGAMGALPPPDAIEMP
ncbi:MAG: hypothetical protein RLZZ58_1239 [Pseudomonadota bacterium]